MMLNIVLPLVIGHFGKVSLDLVRYKRQNLASRLIPKKNRDKLLEKRTQIFTDLTQILLILNDLLKPCVLPESSGLRG